MKFISAYKAERNIQQLLAETDPHSPAAQKALQNLASSGPAAIPIMIDALAGAKKPQLSAIVHVLSKMVSDRTFDEFAKGMCHINKNCAIGSAKALEASDNFDAGKLLSAIKLEDIATNLLIDVMRSHLDELDINGLLHVAYKVEPNMKKAAFKLIEMKATSDMIPDLMARTEGRDHSARVCIINILAKFSTPEVQFKLEQLLQDSSRQVRAAALEAMGKLSTKQDVKLIASMLLDNELEVQSKAIDLLVQINDPNTCKYLINVLRHDSEYTRRSAVEVLNAIADPGSVKHLLKILGDEDWWVRSRACDALGKIGNDDVIHAVIKLVRDENENVRRSAIEILNHTQDPRAIKYLIQATHDQDWWVVERAVDALGGMGSNEALPRLLEMIEGEPKAIPAVVRAISKIGAQEVVPKILPLLHKQEQEILTETVKALSKLASADQIAEVRSAINQMMHHQNSNVALAAAEAMDDFDIRFTPEVLAQNEIAAKLADTSHTLLLDTSKAQQIAAEGTLVGQSTISTATSGSGASAGPANGQLDINELHPGTVIEDRYRFIQKIGKGAFGTVFLVEDTVVEEQLILKFLNPNVSTDEEMLKRFVHELRFSRKITHKNVIRIYDFLNIGGSYAISMEYFPSHTLGQEMPNKQPLPFDKAAGWAKDIATGMSVAHQVGIVHRDLKPANLLIDDYGLLKIVDFGVASAAGSGSSELTKTGYVIGSPKYMAPEQILGKKVDHRADIYSLGVILYEMLTGSPPYTKGDQMAVMYQHVQGKCMPCTEVNPDIPPALGAIVKKAMEIDKSHRFESMDEFRAALEQAIAG